MSGPVAVSLRDLSAGYGAVSVLRNITVDIPAGKVTILLGHNGAGKSTLAKALMGVANVSGGQILLDSVDIQPLSTAERLRRGVSLVLQEQAVFPDLSVLDNLRVGAICGRPSAAEYSRLCESVFALFPILKEFRGRAATSLSGGQQRMLAIAMGLMTRPRFLILDEPSLGLSPKLVGEVIAQVEAICRMMGVTILLVEQNVEAALRIGQHVIAIRSGAVIFAGDASRLGAAKDIVDLL